MLALAVLKVEENSTEFNPNF